LKHLKAEKNPVNYNKNTGIGIRKLDNLSLAIMKPMKFKTFSGLKIKSAEGRKSKMFVWSSKIGSNSRCQ